MPSETLAKRSSLEGSGIGALTRAKSGAWEAGLGAGAATEGAKVEGECVIVGACRTSKVCERAAAGVAAVSGIKEALDGVETAATWTSAGMTGAGLTCAGLTRTAGEGFRSLSGFG